MKTNVTQQTIDMVKTAQQTPIAKADTTGITQQSGLQYYDLQPAAKLLYPVLTPLRNEIPRVAGKGGESTHWKAVTGVNVGRLSLGVAEGHRNAVMQTRTEDKLAKYATIGLENAVTDEAQLGAENFDDVKAMAVLNLLQATMIGEEALIIGGNSSLALGTTPTPTLATVTTGGSLAAATAVSVIAVALTFEGYMSSSVASGVPGVITRTNADGTQDAFGGGSAAKSAAATVTTGAGTTNSITASVTPVAGAVGYAWYWGAAGAEKLGAITSLNSVVIKDVAAGTQLASALTGDNSKNGLVFDGLMTQIATPGSGAYMKIMPSGTPGIGTGLTADGSAGIAEFDEAFRYFWDNFRVSPDEILCSAREIGNITKKIIAGGGSPLFRFNVDAQAAASGDFSLTAGVVIGSYLNKYAMGGGQLVAIRLHPNVPPGTTVFRKKSVPYPMANINNILEVRYLQDYYQTEWPRRTRAYEYGVYSRQVLACYAPFCFGMISNIADA